ncbi:hypothetical protein BC833DRAFT_622862 [Globomyces pollinis-pini]|nr:hypothetical protein BC833DRAFT_622862 [Globomyces pollinis-pini]
MSENKKETSSRNVPNVIINSNNSDSLHNVQHSSNGHLKNNPLSSGVRDKSALSSIVSKKQLQRNRTWSANPNIDKNLIEKYKKSPLTKSNDNGSKNKIDHEPIKVDEPIVTQTITIDEVVDKNTVKRKSTITIAAAGTKSTETVEKKPEPFRHQPKSLSFVQGQSHSSLLTIEDAKNMGKKKMNRSTESATDIALQALIASKSNASSFASLKAEEPTPASHSEVAESKTQQTTGKVDSVKPTVIAEVKVQVKEKGSKNSLNSLKNNSLKEAASVSAVNVQAIVQPDSENSIPETWPKAEYLSTSSASLYTRKQGNTRRHFAHAPIEEEESSKSKIYIGESKTQNSQVELSGTAVSYGSSNVLPDTYRRKGRRSSAPVLGNMSRFKVNKIPSDQLSVIQPSNPTSPAVSVQNLQSETIASQKISDLKPLPKHASQVSVSIRKSSLQSISGQKQLKGDSLQSTSLVRNPSQVSFREDPLESTNDIIKPKRNSNPPKPIIKTDTKQLSKSELPQSFRSDTKSQFSLLNPSVSGDERFPLINDAFINNSHFSLNTMGNSTSPSSGFTKLITKVIDSYCRRVSYQKESLLFLLLLLPFVFVFGTVITCHMLTYSSKEVANIYKIMIILVGLLAVKCSHLINQRHQLMTIILKVIRGGATFGEICRVKKGHGHDAFLQIISNQWYLTFILAFCFYFFLIALQFSIKTIPVRTPYGTGIGYRLQETFYDSFLNETDSKDLFQTALGAQFDCAECHLMVTNSGILVPISKGLVHTDSSENYVIMGAEMDIISVRTSCLYDYASMPETDKDSITLTVNDILRGNRAASVDFHLSSYNSAGVQMSVRCIAVANDYRGYAEINYRISDVGHANSLGVEHIRPLDSTSCKTVGGICLNKSKREGLSYSLFKNLFDFDNISVHQKESSEYLPDPAKRLSKETLSFDIGVFLGNSLLVSSSIYTATTNSLDLFNMSVAVKFQVDSIFQLVTALSAVICIVWSIVIIVYDVTSLDYNNVLLRRLSRSFTCETFFLEEMAELTKKMFEHAPPLNPNWKKEIIRYGESLSTINFDIGILRFGHKNDLIKFKDGREYK